eukprot:CAMPEP_0173258902 /NCGR_PEP_ID=MMETSP1142-20121109/24656_1 /TAXON_ID=483371 /ORGANISM="non described non described, Strain CCMP2298" /LENGTH=61 /DNA_ID=CAMNT_0014193339 /DNA_START=34 /DNA_END=216 /DNA_ORIENTATION=+
MVNLIPTYVTLIASVWSLVLILLLYCQQKRHQHTGLTGHTGFLCPNGESPHPSVGYGIPTS